jgi:hypothetical protein
MPARPASIAFTVMPNAFRNHPRTLPRNDLHPGPASRKDLPRARLGTGAIES